MSENFLQRTRRLLLLIPAAWKATAGGGPGLSIGQAMRITGARSPDAVRADVESLQGLSLSPSFPDDEMLLQIDGDRIFADRTLLLSDPPRLSLREGVALTTALQPFADSAGLVVSALIRKLRKAIPEYLREKADELGRATEFHVSPPGEWSDALEEAIDRRLEVTIEYRASATGDASRKVLEPRLVFPQDAHWYLAAWNVEKCAEHLYRLDRIVSVEIGTRVFGEHQGPPIDRYARKQLYFQSGTEREVKVRFANVAAKIASERWPSSAQPQPDGSVVVTAKMTPGPYFYGWVLGFGIDAEVVEPADVRQAFLEHVDELRKVYSSPAAPEGT